jgi:excisionase family DNA binding protein
LSEWFDKGAGWNMAREIGVRVDHLPKNPLSGAREMKDYFTVNELAEHFGVNPKTIYRRLWAKQIPAYKVGRSWRIAKKDIRWLRQ